MQPCKSGEGWIWVPLPPPPTFISSVVRSDTLRWRLRKRELSCFSQRLIETSRVKFLNYSSNLIRSGPVASGNFVGISGQNSNTPAGNTNNAAVGHSLPEPQRSRQPLKKSDGGGLFLLVTPTGGKLWRLSYRFDGKQKTLAFGQYPAVGLADARRARDDAKEQLAAGIDPALNKNAEKRARKIAATNTFESIAREWHTNRSATWTGGTAVTFSNGLKRIYFRISGHGLSPRLMLRSCWK